MPDCRSRPFPLLLCGIVALLLPASLAAAQSVTSHAAAANTGDDELAAVACSAEDQEAGSWLASRLPGHGGISIAPVYYGEVFTNTRGGLSTNDATQYFGLMDLGLEWDFQQSGLGLPGRFFLLAQNTHGRGLTIDFVGDTQVISNIDSFKNVMRVSEYWWEFGFLDGAVTVRLGKQDLNTEFLVIDLAVDFIQSTFGLSPSTAFPTYPDQAMGAVVLMQLSDSWQLKAGVWDVFAPGGGWGFSGNESVLVIGELQRPYALADANLPGTFAMGAIYESAGAIEDDPISPVREYYVQLEQLVYREDAGDDDGIQGLGAFAAYHPRFPGTQKIDESIGDSFVAGAIYTGLIPGRDEDVVGTGVAWTALYRGGTNQETVVEFFYKAQLTPRTFVQPDLQYVASPSGIYRDALVAGIRFQVAL